jgi:hypothetical protein
MPAKTGTGNNSISDAITESYITLFNVTDGDGVCQEIMKKEE